MLEVNGHRIVILRDVSGSMDEMDCDGQTRHNFIAEKLASFAPAAAQSAAGQVVYLLPFNSRVKDIVQLRTAADVAAAEKKYGTGGSTGTADALEQAWKLHNTDPSVPTMVFLVTDGHPDSESDVDREIIAITKRMKAPEEFRIMILTVGERNDQLNQWLEHLDADLAPSGAAFDIVGENELAQCNFQESAAELIKSTTTNSEAAAGHTEGKKTVRVD